MEPSGGGFAGATETVNGAYEIRGVEHSAGKSRISVAITNNTKCESLVRIQCPTPKLAIARASEANTLLAKLNVNDNCVLFCSPSWSGLCLPTVGGGGFGAAGRGVWERGTVVFPVENILKERHT